MTEEYKYKPGDPVYRCIGGTLQTVEFVEECVVFDKPTTYVPTCLIQVSYNDAPCVVRVAKSSVHPSPVAAYSAHLDAWKKALPAAIAAVVATTKHLADVQAEIARVEAIFEETVDDTRRNDSDRPGYRRAAQSRT